MNTVIAVDLGATNVRVAQISKDGRILNIRKDTVAGWEGTAITARIVSLISEVMDETVTKIGISTAGPIDIKRGCVVGSPNMHAPEISLVKPLSDKFNMPVKMLTDCKAGVIGEHVFGCGKDCDNLAYITISSGIGCGILQNGILIEGADGNAGEAGHFIVDTCYNMPCGCGGAGHWESYCSGSGIPKFFDQWCKSQNKSYGEQTTEEILTQASRGEEPHASFSTFLKQINMRGLQSVICAYNPAKIILDGPIALNHSWLFSDLNLKYLRNPEILFSKLEGNAPLLGAAAYAYKSFLCQYP